MTLAGCSSRPNIDQYANNNPKFAAKEFFSGSLIAHGIVKDRSGQVIRYFTAELNGEHQDDGTLLLKERFVFNDGEVQYRDWTMADSTATAGDVIGEAQLSSQGNALYIDYTLEIPYKDSTLHVQVDDRMHRVSDNVVINQSYLKKWGFRVGEVILTIIKQP
jgi:hypothetical protein